jgi:hypothetical protein
MGDTKMSFVLGRKCPFYMKDGLGIVESPNFPGEYPASSECHWRVRPGVKCYKIFFVLNAPKK